MHERTWTRVRIGLGRIRDNVRSVAAKVGRPVWAVVKSDAYGLGAGRVAEAIRDLVEGYCVFSAEEAIAAELWQRTARPAIALGPPTSRDAEDYRSIRLRPAVSGVEQARDLRAARPILCVDTGMQRFACGAQQVDGAIEAGGIDEAFTHATKLAQVQRLRELTRGHKLRLHAAATALLDEPEAWLDLVRPGLALYAGAVRVSTPLVEAQDSAGPAGYTGFESARHGVILCGYSDGLRRGPCLVNGVRRRIMEVGMQSAYVELGPEDRARDEVVLLGDGLEVTEVGAAWGATPHEVLLRLSGAGRREYL